MEEAIKLITLSAKQNYALAQYKLACCYDNGIGVEEDLKEAVNLYQMSANQNNALAQHNLAVCYQNGRGVEMDINKAIMLYRLSAEQNNASSQNNLAWLYESGKGVESDMNMALKLYKQSADQGLATAQYNLARYYFNIDKKESIKLYSLCADKNFQHALAKLKELEIKCPFCRQLSYIGSIKTKTDICDVCYERNVEVELNGGCKHYNLCLECYIGILKK